MKVSRLIILGILFIAILIQFFGGDLPKTKSDNPNDLIGNNQMDEGVKQTLKVACYDCHSNLTRYPWYSKVAPVSWLVIRDVREGRDELNFSEWESFSKKRKIKKLKELIEEVDEGEMPMPVYKITHTGARLNEIQKKALMGWAKELSGKIADE